MKYSNRLNDDAIRGFHTRYLAGEPIRLLTEEAGYKPEGLRAAFKRLGLKSLGRTNWVPLHDPRAVKALDLWRTGATAKAAGESAGLSQTIMSRLLRESGYTGLRYGPAHAQWKGGRGKHASGYIHVYVAPDDPMRAMRRTGGHVMEHRLIMARHLRRPLGRHETVHHINGVRDDNRIENLQLRVGHHGPGGSWRCANCGSTDVEPLGLAEPERHQNRT